jgi:frataxin-like iron-binding protein CyaY
MIKTKRLLLNDVYRDIDDKYLCKYYINNEYTSIDYDIIKGILDLKMDLKDTTIIEKCAKTLPIIEYALHIGYHFNIERINFIALNIVNVYNIYNRYRNQCNNPDYLDIKKNSLLINHILNSSNDNDNNTVDNSISLDHILIDLKYMIQYGAVLDKKFVIEYNYIDIDEEFDLDTLHNENILSDEQYRQCQQWISEKGEENRRLVIPTKKAELPEKMSEIIHVTRFIGKLSTNELTIINNNPIIF